MQFQFNNYPAILPDSCCSSVINRNSSGAVQRVDFHHDSRYKSCFAVYRILFSTGSCSYYTCWIIKDNLTGRKYPTDLDPVLFCAVLMTDFLRVNLPYGGTTLSIGGINLPIGENILDARGNNLSISGRNLPAEGINLPIVGINLPIGGINLSIVGINLPTGGINLPIVGINLLSWRTNLPIMLTNVRLTI